jgi:hypothetical protein
MIYLVVEGGGAVPAGARGIGTRLSDALKETQRTGCVPDSAVQG